MRVKRKELILALKKCAMLKGVDTVGLVVNDGWVSLRCSCFGVSLEVSVSAVDAQPGGEVASCRLDVLLSTLQMLTVEDVDIVILKKGVLVLKAVSGGEYKLALDFSERVNYDDGVLLCTVDALSLRFIVGKSRICCSRDDLRPAFMGLRFSFSGGIMYAFATDGYMGASVGVPVVYGEGVTDGDKAGLSREGVVALSQLLSVCDDGDLVYVRGGEHGLCFYVRGCFKLKVQRLSEDNIPDIMSLISKNRVSAEKNVVLEKSAFVSVLRSLRSYAGDFGAVRIGGLQGNVHFFASDYDWGRSADLALPDLGPAGEGFVADVNLDKMLSIVGAVDNDAVCVEVSDEKRQVFVGFESYHPDASCVYVLMQVASVLKS